MASEPKKNIILRVLEILYRYSDEEHHLKQSDIIDLLKRDYDIDCERKAVGRNISYLKDAGFDIGSDKSGSYIAERIFELSELRVLIDSVLCSRYISEKYTKDLAQKLSELGGKYFKSHVKHVYSTAEWNKTDNADFFLNVELADEAIEKGKQIQFVYNKLGLDKKMMQSSVITVSPYQMLLHNQHYYLMAKNEVRNDMEYYRMDKMTDMRVSERPATPLREVKGYENGINYAQLSTAMPYMFSAKPEMITLKCQNFMMDHLYDWFGKDFSVRSDEEGSFVASVTASKPAMVYWVMQYGTAVEVLKPLDLRREVAKAARITAAKYSDVRY